jgi:hypothetical protein
MDQVTGWCETASSRGELDWDEYCATLSRRMAHGTRLGDARRRERD